MMDEVASSRAVAERAQKICRILDGLSIDEVKYVLSNVNSWIAQTTVVNTAPGKNVDFFLTYLLFVGILCLEAN
jgi:hypothetical protein